MIIKFLRISAPVLQSIRPRCFEMISNVEYCGDVWGDEDWQTHGKIVVVAICVKRVRLEQIRSHIKVVYHPLEQHVDELTNWKEWIPRLFTAVWRFSILGSQRWSFRAWILCLQYKELYLRNQKTCQFLDCLYDLRYKSYSILCVSSLPLIENFGATNA